MLRDWDEFEKNYENEKTSDRAHDELTETEKIEQNQNPQIPQEQTTQIDESIPG